MDLIDVNDVSTVAEMRAVIFGLTATDPIVHRVMRMCDLGGLSAEDRYTTLAYYLLADRAWLVKKNHELTMQMAVPT